MPGQLKEVRSRIKSTQSTQQITKAMKMVSAAKLRKAQDNIIKIRPYSKNLFEVCQHVLANETDLSQVPFLQQRDTKHVLFILITSDRGLCGGYNSNIIKLAKHNIQEKYANAQITFWHLGKKGFEGFAKFQYQQNTDFKDIFINYNYTQVSKLAQKAIEGFLNKTFDIVDVIYSEFKNAASQMPTVERFLPITLQPATTKMKTDFIFEPDKLSLLNALIPAILTNKIHKAILDAQASEHGARMTAMDKASDNANELLKNLKVSYNRARQAAITTELTEIVSGAAALKG